MRFPLNKTNLITALWISFIITGTASAAQKPNILLLCIDDLRPELPSFGATYIKAPNIERLASKGRIFTRHYVNASSCGPSRYTMLTGRYGPAGNEALFSRAKKVAKNPTSVPPSMPEWFRTHGYTTVSVGKVSHHPSGRGGGNWDDDSILEVPKAWDRHLMPVGEWETPRGAMHGLANGEVRQAKRKSMDVFQSTAGSDTIYPDGLIAEEAMNQLGQLAHDKKPFFLAVGIIRPHLPFGAPKKYFDLYQGITLPPIPHPTKPKGQTTWHGSGEFRRYNLWGKDPNTDAAFADDVRRHYAACVSYADAQVGKILAKLKAIGADKNTIIIVWGDHGWHLGEHAVWGKHTLFEESLRSPLIIYYPNIPSPGKKTQSMVETLDLFPTLCELTHLPTADFAQGKSLKPILKNPTSPGHFVVGYYGGNKTIRTPRYRLILHKDGSTELYDHTTPAAETKNISASHPQIVQTLKTQLLQKLATP